ncbi:MAG: hypothetical protein ACK52V_16115 [Betaproteobacteria bacterium]
MTPEGQMCQDMHGELVAQWEGASGIAKAALANFVPPLLLLLGELCERLDAAEKRMELYEAAAVAAGRLMDLGPARVARMRELMAGGVDVLAGAAPAAPEFTVGPEPVLIHGPALDAEARN